MVTKRRVIIALLELAIVAALLVYALAPRSLERATGGVYDPGAWSGPRGASTTGPPSPPWRWR